MSGKSSAPVSDEGSCSKAVPPGFEETKPGSGVPQFTGKSLIPSKCSVLDAESIAKMAQQQATRGGKSVLTVLTGGKEQTFDFTNMTREEQLRTAAKVCDAIGAATAPDTRKNDGCHGESLAGGVGKEEMLKAMEKTMQRETNENNKEAMRLCIEKARGMTVHEIRQEIFPSVEEQRKEDKIVTRVIKAARHLFCDDFQLTASALLKPPEGDNYVGVNGARRQHVEDGLATEFLLSLECVEDKEITHTKLVVWNRLVNPNLVEEDCEKVNPPKVAKKSQAAPVKPSRMAQVLDEIMALRPPGEDVRTDEQKLKQLEFAGVLKRLLQSANTKTELDDSELDLVEEVEKLFSNVPAGMEVDNKDAKMLRSLWAEIDRQTMSRPEDDFYPVYANRTEYMRARWQLMSSFIGADDSSEAREAIEKSREFVRKEMDEAKAAKNRLEKHRDALLEMKDWPDWMTYVPKQHWELIGKDDDQLMRIAARCVPPEHPWHDMFKERFGDVLESDKENMERIGRLWELGSNDQITIAAINRICKEQDVQLKASTSDTGFTCYNSVNGAVFSSGDSVTIVSPGKHSVAYRTRSNATLHEFMIPNKARECVFVMSAATWKSYKTSAQDENERTTNHMRRVWRGLSAEDREFVEKRIKEAEAADPGKGCAMVVKEMLRSVRASVITFFKDGMHKFTLKNSFTYTQSCEVSYRDVLPISPPIFYALEADDVDMYKKAVREAADRMKHETDDWDWEDLHVEQVWLAMKTDVSNSFNPTVSICAPYAETVEGIPDKPRLSDIFNSWPDVRATTADEESAKDAASGQFNALTLGELASVMGSVNLLSWYFGHMTTHNYKGNEARFATMEKAERDKQPQRILLQPLRWFYSRMVALALTWERRAHDQHRL